MLVTCLKHSGNVTKHRDILAGSKQILHLFSLPKYLGRQVAATEALRYRNLSWKHGCTVCYLCRGKATSWKWKEVGGNADSSLHAAYVPWVWHTALYFYNRMKFLTDFPWSLHSRTSIFSRRTFYFQALNGYLRMYSCLLSWLEANTFSVNTDVCQIQPSDFQYTAWGPCLSSFSWVLHVPLIYYFLNFIPIIRGEI